jgi:hypothetical protein
MILETAGDRREQQAEQDGDLLEIEPLEHVDRDHPLRDDARQVEDPGRELETHAGQRRDAEHEADTGAGRADRQRRLGAHLETLHQRARPDRHACHALAIRTQQLRYPRAGHRQRDAPERRQEQGHGPFPVTTEPLLARKHQEAQAEHDR